VENYSDIVISLFEKLRSKRKLIDILDLLEDATSCYLNEHDVPVATLISDFDQAIEKGCLEHFTKIEIKKIYKVLNKFDKNYTILKTSKKTTPVEKLVDMINNKEEFDNNNKMDNFIVKLRKKTRAKITKSPIPINTVEEYNDDFNAHYIHFYYGKKEQKFAIIIVQNNLVMYHSYVTNRKYPINLKKNDKGIDTLINVFLERDLEEIKKHKE